MQNSMDQLTSAYNEHHEELFLYSLAKTSNRELSHDLVQATFMKTCMYLRKGKKVKTIRAFLYHILRGLIIDEYRKNKPASLDSLIESGFEPISFHEVDVLRIIDGKMLFELIKRLPAAYRRVVDLRYREGLLTKEISDITGQSPNTVATQIHRGLGKMRELIQVRA